MEMKKEFDTLQWVREVRDEHHRRWGHLPMDQFVRKVAEEGENTELAKRFKQKNTRGRKE